MVLLRGLQENQIRFSELFNRYDRSGRGRLSMSDLYRFAADVLDVVDRSDVKYLQVPVARGKRCCRPA